MTTAKLSQSNWIDQLLTMYGHTSPIVIVSGEGDGQGTVKPYTGKVTGRAIVSRLTRERCGGQRWARAVIRVHPEIFSVAEGTGHNLDLDSVGYTTFPRA